MVANGAITHFPIGCFPKPLPGHTYTPEMSCCSVSQCTMVPVLLYEFAVDWSVHSCGICNCRMLAVNLSGVSFQLVKFVKLGQLCTFYVCYLQRIKAIKMALNWGGNRGTEYSITYATLYLFYRFGGNSLGSRTGKACKLEFYFKLSFLVIVLSNSCDSEKAGSSSAAQPAESWWNSVR